MKKLTIAMLVISTLLSACTKVKETNVERDYGTLRYVANGEDFIREGFLTKDRWFLEFEHVYITLGNISSYQTNPPYQSEEGDIVEYEDINSLEKIYTVDLAAGDDNADPILVDQKEVTVGFYNAISWELLQAKEGDQKGNSLILQGIATKSDKSVPFYIAFDHQWQFIGGEYIGDIRKGIVKKGEQGEIEMTFHFDHLFGDGTLPVDDDLNIGALGFEPFYSAVDNDEVYIEAQDITKVLSKEEMKLLTNIFSTLGHVGEGHCYSQLVEQ